MPSFFLVCIVGTLVAVAMSARLGSRVAAAGLSAWLGSASLGCPLLTQPVQAAPLRFLASSAQSQLDQIADYQRPIISLSDSLKPTLQPNAVGTYVELQLLKDGREDAAVVLTTMETYIKPLQKKMAALAPALSESLDSQTDKERVVVLPQLMQGHILELEEAIKTQQAKSELKEVEEVSETLSEFLKLGKSAKLEVEPFVPTRPLSDKDLFGPLGCEWWGRERILGSNSCAPEQEVDSSLK